jgi:hypothetical protein
LSPIGLSGAIPSDAAAGAILIHPQKFPKNPTVLHRGSFGWYLPTDETILGSTIPPIPRNPQEKRDRAKGKNQELADTLGFGGQIWFFCFFVFRDPVDHPALQATS